MKDLGGSELHQRSVGQSSVPVSDSMNRARPGLVINCWQPDPKFFQRFHSRWLDKGELGDGNDGTGGKQAFEESTSGEVRFHEAIIA